MNNKILDSFSKEELIELIEIYSKDWLAMDGVWFQSVEKKYGISEAMYHDAQAWDRFTVIEALKIKKFLGLPDNSGIEDEITVKGNTLTYRAIDCRVQTARKRKGMDYHPCKSVGIIEYSKFAKTIDDRFTCECLSCYPDMTDETCSCAWKFTLDEQ